MKGVPHLLYLALLALAWAPAAWSADGRDPTLAPPAAFATAPAAGDPGAAAKPDVPSLQGAAVLVQGGKPQLVLGAVTYSEGQKLGPYTLERIGETEVWLRSGKTLRKVFLFRGIERHRAAESTIP